jgi:hypothetical protein
VKTSDLFKLIYATLEKNIIIRYINAVFFTGDENMYKPEDFDIIDMHTHPFTTPDTLIGRYWKTDNMDDFVRELNKVGIYKFAGSVIHTPAGTVDFEMIRKLNRDALMLRDRYPQYTPGIHIHGAYVEESCQELHEMHAQGVRLIGELVPAILGTWEVGAPGTLEIFKEAEKLGMIVNLHWGTEAELQNILTTCPDLNIILAHPGDGDNAVMRWDFVSRYPNLYMDISGTGLFRWGMLRYAVDKCGAEKVLFGSDFSTCSAGMYVYGALSENLTYDEFKLVMGDNFRRLMGM